MSLPNITVPFELPLDIPVLMHPAVVHFVIAIPVVILLLEIINLFFKKRAISVLSLFLIVVVAVAMGAAYFSGGIDGKEAYSLLASEGQAELKEHKLLGAYLLYASVALLILKLLFMAFSQMVGRLFFILILVGFIAVTLKQGKEGGELVYKYGANSEAVSELEDKLEELQEEYDELKEESASKKEEVVKEEVNEEPEKQEIEVVEKREENSSKSYIEENTTSEHKELKVEEEPVIVTEEEVVSSSAISLEMPTDLNATE
jgi:uncharacterized membrane protein